MSYGLFFVDVSDPSQPSVVGHRAGSATSVAFAGAYVYVSGDAGKAFQVGCP
jgi:hypothetical protein